MGRYTETENISLNSLNKPAAKSLAHSDLAEIHGPDIVLRQTAYKTAISERTCKKERNPLCFASGEVMLCLTLWGSLQTPFSPPFLNRLTSSASYYLADGHKMLS